MEIKYKRSYAPKGKNYSVGEVPLMFGYALEIADPRAKLETGKLAPGEVCMMIFGITPEEYAWRESDPQRLDALAARIGKALPKDRLIGYRACSLLGKPVEREIRPLMGEHMPEDDFAARLARERGGALQAGPLDAQLAECRRLQKLCAQKGAPEQIRQDWLQARRALGEGLRAQPSLWLAYEAGMNGRWPAFGFDGRVELFTSSERGERARSRVQQANAGVDVWQIREIEHAALDATLKMLADCGAKQLRVDNGISAAEIALDDLCDETPTENAVLRNFIQREVEYGLRWNRLKAANAAEEIQRGALESMLTLRNFALREIGLGVLYAACVDVGGGRLCTPAARAKLGGTGWCETSGDKCILLGDQEGKKRFLAVFTSPIRLMSFAEQKGANVSAVAMTLEDLVRRAAGNGLMIDPGMIGYCVDEKMLQKARELREKPPMAVRIQPPEPPQAQQEMPKQEKIGLGELPDPDSLDVPKPEEGRREAVSEAAEPNSGSEVKPEAPESNKAPEAKKGLFRRLFGKRG